MTRIYIEFKGEKYLKWCRHYWKELGSFKHDCGKVLVKYKKFRKFRGEMQEVKQGNRICPNCQVGY